MIVYWLLVDVPLLRDPRSPLLRRLIDFPYLDEELILGQSGSPYFVLWRIEAGRARGRELLYYLYGELVCAELDSGLLMAIHSIIAMMLGGLRVDESETSTSQIRKDQTGGFAGAVLKH